MSSHTILELSSLCTPFLHVSFLTQTFCLLHYCCLAITALFQSELSKVNIELNLKSIIKLRYYPLLIFRISSKSKNSWGTQKIDRILFSRFYVMIQQTGTDNKTFYLTFHRKWSCFDCGIQCFYRNQRLCKIKKYFFRIIALCVCAPARL